MVLVLFTLFVVIPIAEISLLIQVGNQLGAMTTIALVILTAMVGASLVRSQGLQTLMSLQNRIAAGEQPAQEILEGVMLAIAGILLVTPGFMTDALGLVFLTPWSRHWLAQQGLKRIKVKMASQGGFGAGFGGPGFGGHGFGGPEGGRHHDGGNTYEGEFSSQEPPSPERERLRQETPLDGEFQRKDDDK